MKESKYIFNGKDITMNICIQIRAVCQIVAAEWNIDFEEATFHFYQSKTYQKLTNLDTALWAESPQYIADLFFDEKGNVRVRS